MGLVDATYHVDLCPGKNRDMSRSLKARHSFGWRGGRQEFFLDDVDRADYEGVDDSCVGDIDRDGKV